MAVHTQNPSQEAVDGLNLRMNSRPPWQLVRPCMKRGQMKPAQGGVVVLAAKLADLSLPPRTT